MKTSFLFFSLLLLVSCSSNSPSNPSNFKTIMIKSDGEAETVPDMATFHIDLNCLEQTVKSAKNCLVNKSNELTKKLLSFGISKNDILTTAVNMNKSYVWRNNSSVFEGYSTSTSIYVTVKDLDKLDEIYTELMENRSLDLGGLSFTHSKMDSLTNVAYSHALEKSGVLADKLLEQLPEDKKEVLKIGNIAITASLPENNELKKLEAFDMEETLVARNSSVAISKGTVKVSATLFVEYRIN